MHEHTLVWVFFLPVSDMSHNLDSGFCVLGQTNVFFGESLYGGMQICIGGISMYYNPMNTKHSK